MCVNSEFKEYPTWKKERRVFMFCCVAHIQIESEFEEEVSAKRVYIKRVSSSHKNNNNNIISIL